jgi:hypothetical protein
LGLELWEERSGIGIEEEGGLGLPTENGGGTGGVDGAGQSLINGLGFAGFRDDADEVTRSTEGGDRERVGEPRDGIEVWEGAFADLLLAAGFVELDQFDRVRIVEVGDGRIVEGEVSVLADTEATEIDGLGAEERSITRALGQGLVGVAGEIVKGRGAEAALYAFAEEPAEAGRVGVGDSEVFVHVKEGDAGPVDGVVGGEVLEEADLGSGGSEEDGGVVLPGEGEEELLSCGISCGAGELFGGGLDMDAEIVSVKGSGEGDDHLSLRNSAHSGSWLKTHR